MTLDKTRASTGVPGLDNVLLGGLTPDRLYLFEGMPGSGKTTLAFQFLLEGARRGERVAYVTLSESQDEIQGVAQSHGWPLEGIKILELSPREESLAAEEQYTVLHPSEVELSDTTRPILDLVGQYKPLRIVIDSLSELRLLAGSALRYRRQILALKRFFAGRKCTVILLDDLTAQDHDLQVQSIAHGVLLLELTKPAFGSPRRRISVSKFRGSEFRAGYHNYTIRRGGIEVFPRLIAAEHRQPSSRAKLSSSLNALDKLMRGGLERGTSTLIQGAAGTGKSTIACLFAAAAAERGEHVSLFLFDESANTLYSRMAGFKVPIREYATRGLIDIKEIDPAELSPGELATYIRRQAERQDASIIVIDSLNGYLNSMPDENYLIIQLHELLAYLGQMGIATILITAQHGILSGQLSAPVDVSYLADSVMWLRYFEDDGEVKQAISVIKMRGGDHERNIREFKLRDGTITVGEPLRNYHGILTGVPKKRLRS